MERGRGELMGSGVFEDHRLFSGFAAVLSMLSGYMFICDIFTNYMYLHMLY